MAYIWNRSLETGNKTIDSQHKQLIGVVNSLLDASAQGKGDEQFNKTMDFLIRYTVRHFADEEALQQRYRYPGYREHKQRHEEFKVVVNALAEQLRKEGPTATLLIKFNASIAQWLINHIQCEDVKIAEHIRASMAV